MWYDVTVRILLRAVTYQYEIMSLRSGARYPIENFVMIEEECKAFFEVPLAVLFYQKRGLEMKMKKAVPVIVALVLIVLIGVGYVGKLTWDKYSYGKEKADLDEYYGVGEGQLAIVLQDDRIPENALAVGSDIYFDYNTVRAYLNDGFYLDREAGMLLYTMASDTVTTSVGASDYSDRDGIHGTEYELCFMQEDKLYIAAAYVKKFTNYSYEVFDRHLQIYTQWGERKTAEVAKDTQLRVRGGIKSLILKELAKGETVEVLEEMETWSEVKTSDSMIGYVENKYLDNYGTEVETPVTDYVEEYTSIAMDGKVCLGWHSVGGPGGNDTLDQMLAESKGINVIAPTWFSLTDNEGNFRSFASQEYVDKAHRAGLQVWGVVDNFNYELETSTPVSSYEILSSTSKRQRLAQNVVETAASFGLDGINVDFEGISVDCGEHYVQFLRELSVLCRREKLILSTDNPVPFQFNRHYRLDTQGKVVDYVIIMGYDEHWHGSGDPGSVASISYVSDGLDKTLEQVPAEKVVSALPFYTILWKTEGTKVTDQYITMTNMENFVKHLSKPPVWDETTCQNYAEWQEGNVRCQIWIEDEESIKAKLNVMNNKEIGGVAVWRIGYGTPTAWALVSAYAMQ